MKMYILIKESLPIGYALVAAAHASLAAYLKFQDSPEIQEWLSGLFFKTVCTVSNQEFEKAKQHDDFVLISESSLNSEEVALAFKPSHVWPKQFKFFRLYKK